MVVHGEGSLECVKEILDGAAIEYGERGEASVYVTGLAFNFWIFVPTGRHLISMITYEPLPEGVDELAALRCVNAFNQNFPMVQFSVSECGQRLNGRYLLSSHDGLSPAALLRSVRMFSAVFHDAVTDASCLGGRMLASYLRRAIDLDKASAYHPGSRQHGCLPGGD